MLQSLEAARAARASDLEIWQQTAGNALIVTGIFLFFPDVPVPVPKPHIRQ